MSAPYRFMAFLDGRVVEDREFENWAQIGGKIGNLVGDVDAIQVKQNGSLILLYRKTGIL